jgi:uncharacterized protein with HEPN domain
MREDRERLLDILEAITRIERYAARGRTAFEQDELIQNWMVSHIQIVGEACRAMSAQLRDRHPEAPWRAIIGMRHVLVHRYFGIDLDAVWTVVERDLPALKRVVMSMVEESDQAPGDEAQG